MHLCLLYANALRPAQALKIGLSKKRELRSFVILVTTGQKIIRRTGMMEMGVLIWEHPALCSIPEIKEIKFIHAKKEVIITITFRYHLSALCASLCSL